MPAVDDQLRFRLPRQVHAALGVKRIYLGPTLPAFLSETVVKTLVDAYGLQPITAPEQDLDAIQGRG